MTFPFTLGNAVVYYLIGLLYVNEPAFYSFSVFLFYSVARRFGCFSTELNDFVGDRVGERLFLDVDTLRFST